MYSAQGFTPEKKVFTHTSDSRSPTNVKFLGIVEQIRSTFSMFVCAIGCAV